jgi:hypothetical protein
MSGSRHLGCNTEKIIYAINLVGGHQRASSASLSRTWAGLYSTFEQGLQGCAVQHYNAVAVLSDETPAFQVLNRG